MSAGATFALVAIVALSPLWLGVLWVAYRDGIE